MNKLHLVIHGRKLFLFCIATLAIAAAQIVDSQRYLALAVSFFIGVALCLFWAEKPTGDKSSHKVLSLVALALVIGFGVVLDAHAGTGTSFNSLRTWVNNELTGSLGGVTGLGAIAIGGVAGMTGNPKTMLASLAVGIGLMTLPPIVSGFFSALV